MYACFREGSLFILIPVLIVLTVIFLGLTPKNAWLYIKYRLKILAEKKAEDLTEKPARKAFSPRKVTSRPSKENRPRQRAKYDPYAHSRPVKKGKGSFRKKAD